MTDTLSSSDSVNLTIANQRRLESRRWRIVAALGAVCIASLILDIATGPSMLPLDDVLKVLTGGEVESMTRIIVYDLRLPMALMALIVGGALGVGGAEIQTLLNNPIASPYTLGLAAAAGLGASMVIAFGSFGLALEFAVPLGAFAMTMVASAILFLFASMQRISSPMLVLAGIALLFLFQSILSLVQYLSAPEISQQILFWLFGSLTKATWQNLAIISVTTLLCTTMLFRDAWKLTALRLGEARAASLGINTTHLRLKTLLLVSTMTAVAISFVGIIGFIGLVAPHIARMMVGEDQRFFLPMSMITGAAFLSVASVLSKTVVPGALFPVGIVTSFVGVPFFFWIMLSRK